MNKLAYSTYPKMQDIFWSKKSNFINLSHNQLNYIYNVCIILHQYICIQGSFEIMLSFQWLIILYYGRFFLIKMYPTFLDQGSVTIQITYSKWNLFPPSWIISFFDFSRCIVFSMHQDIYHVWLHSKIYVSKKAKTTNYLGWRE